MAIAKKLMDHKIRQAKWALREKIAAKLRELTQTQRDSAGAQARALLSRTQVWHESRSVLFYAPLPGELDTWGLLEKALADGRTVGLPRFDTETDSYIACRIEDLAADIVAGRFGIREPAARCTRLAIKGLDLILAPGVAF